jgi:hypothetical protein
MTDRRCGATMGHYGARNATYALSSAASSSNGRLAQKARSPVVSASSASAIETTGGSTSWP